MGEECLRTFLTCSLVAVDHVVSARGKAKIWYINYQSHSKISMSAKSQNWPFRKTLFVLVVKEKVVKRALFKHARVATDRVSRFVDDYFF